MKSKKLSPADNFRAVILLGMASTAQTQLWARPRELEEILGCAVNTTVDLETETVTSILKRNESI